jgi:Rrf2 family nitric oxide-sensitive transcriptional repressor
MRVTLNTDFSLRVLMYLATKQGPLATIPEIAARFGISRAHLMKVVHQLGVLGYIATLRGKNGGIRLLRRPADITVGSVMRDTEEGVTVLGCLDDPDYCVIAKACMLRGAFHEASDAFLTVLDKYSLEDLIRPRKALADLLGIAPDVKDSAQRV